MKKTLLFLKFVLAFILILIISESKVSALEIRTLYGSTTTCDHIKDDIFVVWWDKQKDYREGAATVLNSLIETRKFCRDTFGMKDPKGTDKYYYNVYLHDNEPDIFPKGWSQAQGTDAEGYPYLTLPYTLTSPDYHGHVHEGFHIFQYNANSPGFKYQGDSQWFIEATANWFVNIRYPNDVNGFICGEAVTAIPQVPMWYSFRNKKPGDKNSWLRDDHQYGMNIYLYYLTEVCKVPRYTIGHSFYENVSLLPQEYLLSRLGGTNMRNFYADWAIHSAVGFDYLTAAQVERLKKEFRQYGDPNDNHSVVKTYNPTGTDGLWVRVPESEAPAAWGYNVYEINNSSTGTYTIQLNGDDYGSNGTPSRMTARVAISQSGKSNDFYNMEMTSETKGSLNIKVTPENPKLWVVIAATPDHFTGNQSYSYQLKIDMKKND